MLTWPDGSAEPVVFLEKTGDNKARVERDELDDDGNREQIEVRLSQLDWR